MLANTCVDIVNHNTSSGARRIIYERTGAPNQKWDYRCPLRHLTERPGCLETIQAPRAARA
ncbi:RICIN domain-containing protein [Myxococcus xanthus]|uniref:RICIN domain-containing protein n=1 Tax=Myxococcus xanthus TaxID=34 RepID=UPI00148C19AF|nr:RICIN domain-containing protein [Myxococcus xanthus]